MKYIKFTIILFVCLSLFFIIGEAAIRLKYAIHFRENTDNLLLSKWMKREEPILRAQRSIKYEYQPFLLWKAKPNQNSSIIKTNRLGFRDVDHSTIKTGFRIAIVGASSVWGYGSSSDAITISALLEKYLNNKLHLNGNSTKVEVINFGQPGYVSTQEVLLWQTVLDYNPDMVIHFGPFNDLYAGLLGLQPGWNLPGIHESTLVTSTSDAIAILVKEELYNTLDKSTFISWLRHRSDSVPKPTDITKVASEYIKNITIAENIAQAHNIKLFVVFQPSLFYGDKLLSKEEVQILRQTELTFHSGQQYYKDGYSIIRNKLHTEVHLSDDQLIDLTQSYKDINKPLYIDHVHTTDEGYDVLAKNLADILSNKIPEGIK